MLFSSLFALGLVALAECSALQLEPLQPDELPESLRETLVTRSLRLRPRHAAPVFGRSDGSQDTLSPKLMIISLFGPEAGVWPGPLGLYANNVSVPGLSPLYPDVHCDKKGDICQVTTGEGEINAASTISALVASPYFDLKKTYFFVAGIAGVNPACGTLGGVSLAQYAVQVGLEYAIDLRQLAKNYSSTAGFIPLGQHAPKTYPIYIYGTEVFEVSAALRKRALSVMKDAHLEDSAMAKQYRKRYPDAPANQPPNVFEGVVTTSDTYWHGSLLADAFAEYVVKLTNGTGTYCMTAQEDNGILEALIRGAYAKKIDFSRILLMRTGANFDRPPPGESAATSLFFDVSGGFPLSINNIYNAGKHFVHDVIVNWDSLYDKGIPVTNYVGDILGFLKGPFPPNIGSNYSQTG